MKLIGEDVSEKLEITPAKVFIRKIVRKKYASVENYKVMTAPFPKELLPKTMTSASLVAYIATAKYCDALPLYRQESIFKRANVEIIRQRMARWLVKVSDQLVPLYHLLQEKLLESTYLKMDEIRVQVLNEQNKKATSQGCSDRVHGEKFNDAFKTSSGKGAGKKALDRIKALYKIEKDIRHLSRDEKRKVREE